MPPADQGHRPDVASYGAETMALLDLFGVLGTGTLLPTPTRYTASPVTIHALASEVLSDRPSMGVVECGSGASTVWLAAACRRAGRGRVLALEHDERYAERTRRALHAAQLSGHAEVRHAPLAEVTVWGDSYLWYSASACADVGDIDVLFVDGPPGSTGRLARLPALPVLAPSLADGALVVLDDTHRDDEQETLRRWATARDLGGELTDVERLDRAAHLRWRRS